MLSIKSIYILIVYCSLTSTSIVGTNTSVGNNIVGTYTNVDSEFKALLYNVPSNQRYGFAIVQTHSLSTKTLLSYYPTSVYGEINKAVHNGMVVMLKNDDRTVTLYEKVKKTGSQQIDAFAIFSPADSPIPGACCQTCALEIDANLHVTYDAIQTHVKFYRASPYFKTGDAPLCDNSEKPSTFRLIYRIYYYFLAENNLSEKCLLDAIGKMKTPTFIKKYGILLVELKNSDPLSLSTETVFGQGVVFNVVVYDPVTDISTAYVPVATYACNMTDPLEECKKKGSITTLVYCTLTAIVGLVICFFGFKLYRMLLFTCGTILFWIVTFSLLARLYGNINNTDETLIISSLCALTGGGLLLFLYSFERLKYFCLLIVAIVFGMLISAIIFYTPFGYFSVWDVDYRFILGFVCVSLTVATVFLFFPKTVCYLCSSLLGSFGFILLPNYFLRSNMQYIVVTVISRITLADFGSSYLRRPYQKLDCILTGVWGGLFIVGFTIQYCMTRKVDFEISGKHVRNKAWLTISQSYKKVCGVKPFKKLYYTPSHHEYDERTPLLNEPNNGHDNNLLRYDSNTPQSSFSSFKPDNGVSNPFEYQPLIHAPPQTNKSAQMLNNDDTAAKIV